MYQQLNSKRFNLYLHGTNSNLLTLLPHTNFSILSIPEMIRNHGVAPFSGEVDGGGLDAPQADCKPCFGVLHLSDDINPGIKDRVRHFESQAYHLDKILRGYTRDKQISSRRIISLLKNLLEEFMNQDVTRVNILIYYLVLAGQMGIELSDILPSTEQLRLVNHLLLQTRFYYLVKIILKYFKPIKQISYANPEYHFMRDQLAEELNTTTFLNKIKASTLDLKAISNTPSEAQLILVLDLIRGAGQKDFLTIKTHEELASQFKDSVVPPEDPWMHYMCRNVPSYSLESLLMDMIMNDGLDSMFLCRLDLDLDALITALQYHIAALENVLLRYRDSNFHLIQPQDNPFPVVLVIEYPCTTLKLFNSETQEYRAVETLKLGEDIKLIATDSMLNAIKLFEFLQQYKLIDRVEITLFSHLQKCKISNQPPEILNKQDLKLALDKKPLEQIGVIQAVLRTTQTKTPESDCIEEPKTSEQLRLTV